LQGVEASPEMLRERAASESLKGYHLLSATRGIFYMKLGNYAQAAEFLEEALIFRLWVISIVLSGIWKQDKKCKKKAA
jgi:predicted RNA polymerase sigma factor